MKVVVCFDHVRVTVPCGDGTIPVKELINKAVHRYKRATGKGSSHWVEVTSLKTISGGGILDPDDQLNDVVDDREQLIAEFEEQERSSIQHNGGDGASASSTGTTSPDIFQPGNGTSLQIPCNGLTNTSSILGFIQPCQNSTGSNNIITDVVVTPKDLTLGSNLRVRRGSEPSLNLLSFTSSTEKGQIIVGDPRPLIPRRESVRESDDPRSESSDDDKKMKVTIHGSLDRKKLGHNRFTRGALRTSLSNQPEMYHWLEAQENAEQRSKNMNIQERMGPVEGHDGEDVPSSAHPDHCLVRLQNDGGPLGIHAIPAFDESGKDMGLLIQSIEHDRPVHKDGRIQPNDIIVEINGNSLKDVPFLRAQNIFRAAMDTKEICLKIVKGDASNTLSSPAQLKTKQRPAPLPPAVLPKPRSHAPIKPSPLTLPVSESKDATPTPAPRDASKKATSTSESINNSEKANGTVTGHIVANSVTKMKPESLLPSKTVPSSSLNVIKPGPPIKAPKKVPPALPARNPGTYLTALVTDASLNAVTNTRKIGKKLSIQLRKGPLGLGFSITSRDNQTDGNCPIYIRNILPKGAAVQNGQLRPGDRLLEVNGVQMTGKTQADAVYFLRMLPEGSVVDLVLSRQEEVEEKFRVPRQLGDDTVLETGTDDIDGETAVCQRTVSPLQPSHIANEVDIPASDSGNSEKITLHIPLNDTGSAGLGVSVKGKTETSESGIRDLGIFVKTVLKGGAAYKDGHLRVNDKLLEVNGVKLKGLSNTSAMEALRVAMMEDCKVPGVIKLTIARRAGSEPCSPFSGDSPDSSQMDIVLPVAQKRAASAVNVDAIVHQRSSSASEPIFSGHPNLGNDTNQPSPIPPYRSSRVAALRDHFADSPTGLRNESYTKATHESFNEPNTFVNLMPSSVNTGKPQMEQQSHDGRNSWINDNTHVLPNRPHSTIGFMHGKRSSHSSTSDEEVRASVGSNKDESDLSPIGDIILPFAREGFGRQSMSEKRKGHLDPRSTEIYKLVKATKENKGGFLGRRVRSFHVTGSNDVAVAVKGPLKAPSQTEGVSPPIQFDAPAANKTMHVSSNSTYQPSRIQADVQRANVKRASSLEDLVNTEHGIQGGGITNSSEQNSDGRPNRFGRTRACNDSFRAAVDRSYDALDPALMDTLEEESAESGAFTFEPSHSSHSSIGSEENNEDTNSLKRRKAQNKEKKGLLKGFLRFGKGRKSDEDAMRRSRSEERSEDRILDHRTDYASENTGKGQWTAQPYGDAQKQWLAVTDDPNQQHRGRKTSHQEQERIDGEYAKLRDHHVSVQRLRSQSVDPTLGRSAAVPSPSERASPFYPYPGSSAQRQHHLAQQQMDRPDPRNFHPASMTHGAQITGHDYTGKNQSYSNSGQNLDGRVSIAKAVMSRAEYIQHLRQVYQQRHRQRQGVYPLEDREEQYEEQLQERENKQWDPLSAEYETHVRDSHLPRFIDRPSSRQTDPKQVNSYGSSVPQLHTNNSPSFYPGSHHHHQHQQHDPGTQSHPGSRPQSRTGRGGVDPSSSYHHHNNYSDPLYQHRQHHYPQQSHEFANTHFQDQYSSSSDSNSIPLNYHTYDSRPQHFYSGPTQPYHPPPSQYNHHRGNAYADSSSTKV